MDSGTTDEQGPCGTNLLQLLSKQVATLSERLDDLTDQVQDLSTDLRLQARRSAVAAQVPSLSLSHHDVVSHDGSAGCSASVSPRVAGPVSAPTPKARTRHASLIGAASGTLLQQPSAAAAMSEASAASVPAASSPRHAGAAAAALSTSPSAASAAVGPGGAFALVKSWGDDKTETPELKQAMQFASAAAAAAAEAQSAAERCQQQVLELRGRQGQAERRLDTLWQLQETASSNQTAVLQLQGHVDQHQQLQQQQQENMVALRAQVRQSDMSCAANVTACAELRAGLQQLQQRLDQCCKDVARHADQMVELSEQQQGVTDKLRAEMQAAQQEVQEQLAAKQGHIESCAAAASGALGKCEDLRQGAVVLAGRCDAMSGQIKAAVEPLSNRVAELDAKAATFTRATALAKSAVQPEQLASSIAQLSTAASRRDHDRVQQLAGLVARVEKLEGHIATRDQVVTQDDLQHKLTEVRANLAASLTTTQQQLQAQLRTKADEAATSKVTSSLAERLNSIETSLLLGLRALRDKAALLLDSKADAAALKKWQQEVADSLAELRVQISSCRGAQAAAAAQQGGQQGTQQQRVSRGEARHSPPAAAKKSPRTGRYWEYGSSGSSSNVTVTTQSAAAALADILGKSKPVGVLPATVPEPAVEGASVSECAAAAAAALDHASPQPLLKVPELLPAAAQVSDSVGLLLHEAPEQLAGEVVSTGALAAEEGHSEAVPAVSSDAAAPFGQVPASGPISTAVAMEATADSPPAAAALPVAAGPTEEISLSGGPIDVSDSIAAAAVGGTPSLGPSRSTIAAANEAVAAAHTDMPYRDSKVLNSAELPAVAAAAGDLAAAAVATDSSPKPTAKPTAAPGIRKHASTNARGPIAAAGPGGGHKRSQSHIGAVVGAGSLRQQLDSQHKPHPAAAADPSRPFSALQPWSAPKSPPSTSAADLHGAATNAKLVLAGQQKEATRQQLAQKKLPQGVPALASPKQGPAIKGAAAAAGNGVRSKGTSSSGGRLAAGDGVGLVSQEEEEVK